MSRTERPPVWIGHVSINTRDLDASEVFMKSIGLRPIFRNDSVAVMELRGGTHIVLAADPDAEPAEAPFDFMVEDIDATQAEVSKLDSEVTVVERGEIHDWFYATEPGGNRIKFNSSHVPDHDAV